jgi:hypothetical protein
MGRRKIVSTPEEFDQIVDDYVKSRTKEDPITITGVALALGFSSVVTLYEYQKRPEFKRSVKRARTLVENAYEKRLHAHNPTGAIFALKNMGWSDRQDIGIETVAAPTRIELVSPNQEKVINAELKHGSTDTITAQVNTAVLATER